MKPSSASIITSISMVVAAFNTAQAQPEDATVRAAIEGIKAQHSLMQSASAEFELQSNRTPDFDRVYQVKQGGIPEPASQNFHWAFKGDKFYTYSKVNTDFTKTQTAGMYEYTEEVKQFNGKKQYNTLVTMNNEKTKEGQVDISYNRQHTNEWSPLFFGYQIPCPNYLWSDDALKSGDYKFVGASQDAKFGEVLEFAGTLPVAATGQKETHFWLAPRFGYMMIRQREVTRALGREQRDTMNLLKAEKRGGVWFPTQGAASFYEVENGKPVLLTQKTLTVKNFRLNQVADNLFEPRIIRLATRTEVSLACVAFCLSPVVLGL